LSLLKYDEGLSSLIIIDEVRNTQIENKNIVCYEFLYSSPLVALGCSDGVIRFWDYSKSKISSLKVEAHTKPIIKMISIYVITKLI
jgi:WD40 repeat protein